MQVALLDLLRLKGACTAPVVDGVGLHIDSISCGHCVEDLDGFLHLTVLGARLYQTGESWSSRHECGFRDRLLHLPSPGYGVSNRKFETIHVAGSLRRCTLPRRIAKTGWVTHAVC